jgi:hypothetical protein
VGNWLAPCVAVAMVLGALSLPSIAQVTVVPVVGPGSLVSREEGDEA